MDLFGGLHLSPFQFTSLALGTSIVAGLVAWLLREPARRFGFVSRRRRDRFGRGRIPLTGGPGLLAGIGAALIVVGAPLEPAWLVAAIGFFLVGLADDAFDLRPVPKMGLQGAVALAAALATVSSPAHVGFVFLVYLLIVNASNYLDNMDALLAGVALTQAVVLMGFGTVPGPGSTLLVWALPGVALLTLPPARVYLGDSGSHLIGALLAIDAVAATRGLGGSFEARALIPLALVFAVSLADVATVTISRLRRKRPLFRGGTDHLSHRLVRLGLPVPRAVFLLVLASAVCGVSALLLLHF